MTSSTVVLILARPPVGSASTVSQTRHFTVIAALLKIICSLRHFLHFTFTNLLLRPCMSTTTDVKNKKVFFNTFLS